MPWDKPCKLYLRNDLLLSALKALEQQPDLPDRVVDAINAELKAFLVKLCPGAAVSPEVAPSFRRHYHKCIAVLLSDAPHRQGAQNPDCSLLVAISTIGFMLAVLIPPPKQEKLPLAGLDEETLLDTLTLLSGNSLGNPYGTSTLIEILNDVLKQERPDLTEDQAQEALHNAFFLIGGPTPEVIQRIVATGTVGYGMEPAIGATVDEVRRLYVECQEKFEGGLDVRGFADALRDEAKSDDIVRGLAGRWVDIFLFLIPYTWPPPVATANLLPAPPPKGHHWWIAANKSFIRRLKERDHKRVTREQKRLRDLARNLDQIPPDTSGLLEAATLTAREQQVADLIVQGYNQKEIASVLAVTPGRISQIVEQIRAKLKQPQGH